MNDALSQLRDLLNADEPDYPRAAALGPSILPALAQLVTDPDPALASKAASLAGMIDDPAAAQVLQGASRNPHPVVRLAAAGAARFSRVPGAEALATTLLEDTDDGVRWAAARIAEDTNRSRQRPRPRQVITVEPDEPITVPVAGVAGRGESAGEREVEAELNSFGRYLGVYWDNYHAGLNNFETAMSFASDQEARPRYFEVTLKEVAKILLEHALKESLEGFPVLGQVVGAVKSVVTAWYQESERASQAQGDRRIADYLADLRNQAGTPNGPQSRMLRALDDSRSRLLSQYREAVARTGHRGQGERGILTGEAALFLRGLREANRRFQAALPAPAQFAQLFAERFGGSRARTGYISQGGRIGGTLYLSADLYLEGQQWTLRTVESAWTIATTAPRPDRIATALKTALLQQGKTIWQTNLPKMVQLNVEAYVPFPRLNQYSEGWIHFDQAPDRFEVRSNYDLAPFRRAWEVSGIRRRILQVNDLVGSSR